MKKDNLNKSTGNYSDNNNINQNKQPAAASERNKNFLSAIELLEKAQETKMEIEKEKKDEIGFWQKVGALFNPFKCG